MLNRIHGKRIDINDRHVERFFLNRARRQIRDPVVAMLYQDSDPALAFARDRHEKAVVLPLIAPGPTDRALDVGCGLGRWTDELADRVGHYVGTDPIAPFIEFARQKHAWRNNVAFHVFGAEEIDLERLSESTAFDIILIAGVLHYMNDAACEAAFERVLRCAAPECRIAIRVPVSTENRLTLNNEWSQELRHEYSAIYRSRPDYVQWFEAIFASSCFRLHVDVPLYPDRLNNRTDTRQHVFLLQRTS